MKHISKTLRGSLIVGLIIFILFFVLNSPSIFQEGNPLPVVYGIIKLSLTEDGFTKIDEHKYIVKANTNDIQKLKDYLAKNNLVYFDQLGAIYFVKDKNGKRYMATLKMYSTYFMIWDFSNQTNQGLVLPSKQGELNSF